MLRTGEGSSTVQMASIHVAKSQDVRLLGGRYQVRTREYSYHVLRRVGSRTISLFRYDNVHAHPGHPDAHHRHSFDAEGNEMGRSEHVGERGWPTLSEVIEEVHQWWAKQPRGHEAR